MYSILSKSRIPHNKIQLAEEKGLLKNFEEEIAAAKQNNKAKLTNYDVGIIGTGDFASALGVSFIKSTSILYYDRDTIRASFLNKTRISTNRSFTLIFNKNIDFTDSLRELLKARFIVIAIPSSSLTNIINAIKKILPTGYKSKKYVLVSKGFVGKGFLPHRWLQKHGIPFENIIWASGGNVAKELIQKRHLNIAVVSINKNKKYRKEFAKLLDKKYFNPIEYSGSALLASELGGILKNFYAGLGRYFLLQYGEDVLNKYKNEVRKEFVYIARILSKASVFSFKIMVIKKASMGPAFWEDLDATIKNGRNGRFGEAILKGRDVASILEDLGLVESFKTVFSALSLMNKIRFKRRKIKFLYSILEIYEDIHIQYLEDKHAKISEESLSILRSLESLILETEQEGR